MNMRKSTTFLLIFIFLFARSLILWGNITSIFDHRLPKIPPRTLVTWHPRFGHCCIIRSQDEWKFWQHCRYLVPTIQYYSNLNWIAMYCPFFPFSFTSKCHSSHNIPQIGGARLFLVVSSGTIGYFP